MRPAFNPCEQNHPLPFRSAPCVPWRAQPCHQDQQRLAVPRGRLSRELSMEQGDLYRQDKSNTAGMRSQENNKLLAFSFFFFFSKEAKEEGVTGWYKDSLIKGREKINFKKAH